MNKLHQPTGENKRRDSGRDWYNPLRGLTIARAVALLEAGRRGDTTELMWTLDLIGQHDATLRAALQSLTDGVTEMDWDIKMMPDNKLGESRKAQAQRQADTLRKHYEQIENLEDAVLHMTEAEFPGYAHAEMWRKSKDGDIIHLECVPQWHFHKASCSSPWLYDADARPGSQQGTELPENDWLIREVRRPIAPIALICYIRKGLSQKDWDGFLQTYGIPPRWGVLPTDLPAGEEDKWISMMDNAISGSYGVIPNGADVKFGTVNTSGESPFAAHLNYQDEQIMLACLCSLLTSLAKSGSGTLAGNAHADTLQKVIRSLAKRVSVTFQRKIDRDILRRYHPGEPVLAWWQISYEQEVSGDEYLAGAKTVHDIGFTPDPEQITERTGVKIQDSPARPLKTAFQQSLADDLKTAVNDPAEVM